MDCLLGGAVRISGCITIVVRGLSPNYQSLEPWLLPTITPPARPQVCVCVCENEQFPNHTPWPPDVSQIHGSLQPFGGLQRMATLVAINLPYGNGKHTTHRDADDLRFGDGEQQIISIHFHEIDLKQTG